MVLSGSATSSGSNYDVPIGDDTYFSVVGSRGTSISLDSGTDTKLNLKAGLYEIKFSGWIQTTASVTGTFSYELQASSNPLFIIRDVINDRFIIDYTGAASVALVDPSHTTLFNVTQDGSIYFRIAVSNDSGVTWILRGDPTNVLTQIQIMRVSGAV